MKKYTRVMMFGVITTALFLIACNTQINAAQTQIVKVAADATSLKVVAFATTFLETLSSAQRSKTVFTFTDASQKIKWSNLPTGIFQRNGVKLGELTTSQQEALFSLLSSVFSTKGYQQIMQVIDGDEVLKSTGGGNLIFGRAEYYVSFLGTPSATSPWILQFGGHHMAINATVAGAAIALTPSLTGGQPTSYTLNGVLVQPIIGEVNAAFALLNSLESSQKSAAVLGANFIDLILGPGQDGKTLQPEGIKASSLNASQQQLLLELVQTRVGLLNDEDANAKMQEIQANLANTYFAWSGATTAGSPAYFRVTAPTLVLEFSPQSMGGDAANHVHSIYRDPTNDYGINLYQ